MKISRSAIRLLRWMRKDDQWRYYSELERECKHFTYRSFNALKNHGFIDSCVFEDDILDYDDRLEAFYHWHYRISDQGEAYLETIVIDWIPELREWIAIGISIIALIVSIIAIISSAS